MKICTCCGEKTMIKARDKELCSNCFADYIREEILKHDILSYKICGEPLLHGFTFSVCFQPYGTEHSHHDH